MSTTADGTGNDAVPAPPVWRVEIDRPGTTTTSGPATKWRTDPLAWADRRQQQERECVSYDCGDGLAGCLVAVVLVLTAIGLVDLLRWAAGLLPQ